MELSAAHVPSAPSEYARRGPFGGPFTTKSGAQKGAQNHVDNGPFEGPGDSRIAGPHVLALYSCARRMRVSHTKPKQLFHETFVLHHDSNVTTITRGTSKADTLSRMPAHSLGLNLIPCFNLCASLRDRTVRCLHTEEDLWGASFPERRC